MGRGGGGEREGKGKGGVRTNSVRYSKVYKYVKSIWTNIISHRSHIILF